MQNNTRHKHKRGREKPQPPPPRSHTATEETVGQLRLCLTLPKCYLAALKIDYKIGCKI